MDGAIYLLIDSPQAHNSCAGSAQEAGTQFPMWVAGTQLLYLSPAALCALAGS